ncbi:Dps family protein [Specibacter sp. NPDC057265]|uniref:Dps family protein n=1 Tax=Specibacter sp. NPDC057265 TaxID=3346075 RepID=UPI003627A4C1
MAAKETARYTVPGLTLQNGQQTAALLQPRLHALNDLQLTLKHAHWNVVGRDFIAVHEMLDPQIELVRAMVDETAERMATLGLSPNGLPGALAASRSWDDYSLGRAHTSAHLAALDVVYRGFLQSHRATLSQVAELDPVTENMLLGQCGQLELFQWFLRAHLAGETGELSTAGTTTERSAAKSAR